MIDIKKSKNQFYVGEDNQNILAEITYFNKGKGTIVIDHTYVSDELKGQGVGLQLVKSVADHARQVNMKIIPACIFARRVMFQGVEFEDVLIRK